MTSVWITGVLPYRLSICIHVNTNMCACVEKKDEKIRKGRRKCSFRMFVLGTDIVRFTRVIFLSKNYYFDFINSL